MYLSTWTKVWLHFSLASFLIWPAFPLAATASYKITTYNEDHRCMLPQKLTEVNIFECKCTYPVVHTSLGPIPGMTKMIWAAQFVQNMLFRLPIKYRWERLRNFRTLLQLNHPKFWSKVGCFINALSDIQLGWYFKDHKQHILDTMSDSNYLCGTRYGSHIHIYAAYVPHVCTHSSSVLNKDGIPFKWFV